ncbi:hypothetical protein ACTXT7_005908 [Hymenolepis weldensis]
MSMIIKWNSNLKSSQSDDSGAQMKYAVGHTDLRTGESYLCPWLYPSDSLQVAGLQAHPSPPFTL